MYERIGIVLTEPINFMEHVFHSLSPFSAHRISIWGETFATAEHAYQASRILHGPEREAIVNAPSPMDAWREGQKYKNRLELAVPHFDKAAVMEEIFRAKLAQHQDIADVLRHTGQRGLHKVWDDAYWGTGRDGGGQNVMGKIWMKLRDELLTTE